MTWFVRQPQHNKETRSPVLAAVLIGPLLATCSTKENTACPFGATLGFDALGFGRCEADAQDFAAAFVGREWWASGAGHDMNIAGHRKFVNGVDATDLRGHNKTMTYAKTSTGTIHRSPRVKDGLALTFCSTSKPLAAVAIAVDDEIALAVSGAACRHCFEQEYRVAALRAR